MKKYLDYRFMVDQISKGSLNKEQTHIRYVLEWAQEISFKNAPTIRPTFPEYLRTSRLDGGKGQLSPVYIKKALATARLFFSWLSDNEVEGKRIKQSWIKTIKIKRLSEPPKTKEAVTLEEALSMAAYPANTLMQRRARAAAVFLYLSGMRIGAFVSLPMQAVDIPSRKIFQYPNLGVRTKNSKYGITYLLDIPELLKVVQDWDNEIRPLLPPSGFWFAPLSPETGQIDTNVSSIGEHRVSLARRNIKDWLDQAGLPYHSPHKFRHGHIHYGLAYAKSMADFKAVSMNAMHSSMKITDEFYSVLNDTEMKSRINALGKQDNNPQKQETNEAELLIREFLDWKKKQEKE